MTNRLINQNLFLSTASSSLLSHHEVCTRERDAAAAVSQRRQTTCSLGLTHQTTFSGDRVGCRRGLEERARVAKCQMQDKCSSGHGRNRPVS